MNASLHDLLINLAAAGIAFAAGASRRRISFGLRTRALRAFWRPVVNGGFWVAVGSFMEDEYYRRERAGFAGLGDIEAYVKLKSQLHRVGIRDFDLGPGHQVSNEQRKQNLILIGGPHSNPMTALILQSLSTTLQFGAADGPGGKDTTIYDSLLNASTDCRVGPDERLQSDQGLIIRCTNPFAAEKTVLILAGSWGYGTTAAADLMESGDFLKHPVVRSKSPFEAVFSCQIVEGAVGEITLGAVRRIRQ
ncbi:hypothetical protein ACFVIY_19265 [Streptomyces sp. NPDC127166]|uniref:hypothetical protein n=1 Tax=Streptomyces sp. NPDC127166 TaxID=3345380 RepID=UPI0036439A82